MTLVGNVVVFAAMSLNNRSSLSQVYFDHNATTPVDRGLIRVLPELATVWGNPSSIHGAGRPAKSLLRESRQQIASFLGISPLEVVFCSGGSEANNSVLKAVWDERPAGRDEILISAVEHPAISRAARYLTEKRGASLKVIPVDRQGRISIEHYAQMLSERTLLVSVMAANNETGVLFPIRELCSLAHSVGARFHTDAVQMLGKESIDLKGWGVDYASFSGHKVYALKGSGLIYIKTGSPWQSLVHGGGQERARRGGTENLLAQASLGWVLNQIREQGLLASRRESMRSLREWMEAEILRQIPGVSVTGGESPRLPNTSSLVIPGVDGETLLMALDLKGFAVSTGAACSSGSPEPSPALLAMGLSREEAQSSLRLSLGWSNTEQEVESFIPVLRRTVERLRSIQDSGEVLKGHSSSEEARGASL